MAVVLKRVRDDNTYAGNTDLEVQTCPICGITYGVPERLVANARQLGHGKILWYCPNGHQLGYHGKSDAEKAKARAEFEADRAARLQARLDQTESNLRGQKARATRFKNDRDRERKRAAAGVCPCCNRTFQNLARHMNGQHPEFGVEAEGS